MGFAKVEVRSAEKVARMRRGCGSQGGSRESRRLKFRIAKVDEFKIDQWGSR